MVLPCDDPEWSNFTKFFAQNFERFGLKKLISTSYAVESKNAGCGGRAGRTTLPASPSSVGSRVPRDRDDMPVRKRLDHRSPLSIDVSDAWYFITICADGHRSWVGSRVPRDRTPMDFDANANALMSAAQWYHEDGKCRLSLFVIMPDHLHLIAHFPPEDDGGHAGRVTLPMVSVIQQFKSYLARTYGLAFQRGFFDTRIRDDAHYAEKYKYACNNPVRKGFVPKRTNGHTLWFSTERSGHAGRVTLPPFRMTLTPSR